MRTCLRSSGRCRTVAPVTIRPRPASLRKFGCVRALQGSGESVGADIYISGPGHWFDRSSIEDAVEDWLGDRGEVTGGGSGKDGWDIDLSLVAEQVSVPVIEQLLGVLRDANAPAGTTV